MIGINNLKTGGQPADQVIAGIQALVEELTIKLPETQIILLGTFPSGNDPKSQRRQDIGKIQENIATLGDKENVSFLNLNPSFLNSDGSLKAELYSKDEIHLIEEGYRSWAEALLPTLNSLIANAK